MNKPALLILGLSLCSAAALCAEGPGEQLVAASRTDKTVLPGVSLKRPADYVLQRFRVSSDAPEAGVRRNEIFETLRLLQGAASRDSTLELSALPYAWLVTPLRIDPASVKLGAGSRAQTSEVVIGVKTKVAPGADNATALYSKLKEFPTTVRPVGRAAIDLIGDVEVTIVNPEQYREQVIQLYAADVRRVTSALGAEYRVITQGIDRQLQWLRDGMTDVVIFIPYEYDVIPVNVSSYSR